MSMLRNIKSGLRSLYRKELIEQELNKELGSYLEMAAEEKMKQGMSRKDALRAVRLERRVSKSRRKLSALPAGHFLSRPAGKICVSPLECCARAPASAPSPP
jgi:hypothetical protein